MYINMHRGLTSFSPSWCRTRSGLYYFLTADPGLSGAAQEPCRGLLVVAPCSSVQGQDTQGDHCRGSSV